MVYPFVLKNQNTKLIILVGLILAFGEDTGQPAN